MSKKELVKKAIRDFVVDHSLWITDYGNWYIGTTNNPELSGEEHGLRNVWNYWQVDSSHEARELEMYFLSAGMHGTMITEPEVHYVYIFKHSGPGSN